MKRNDIIWPTWRREETNIIRNSSNRQITQNTAWQVATSIVTVELWRTTGVSSRQLPVTVIALSFKKLKRSKSISNNWEPLKNETMGNLWKKRKTSKRQVQKPRYTLPPQEKCRPDILKENMKRGKGTLSKVQSKVNCGATYIRAAFQHWRRYIMNTREQ